MWKARGTRLDRLVAIKILPAGFAQNAQLKTRFEREAKTISQLNHPHICTLCDVGENYLVMERSLPNDWALVRATTMARFVRSR